MIEASPKLFRLAKAIANSRFEYGNPMYGQQDWVKVFIKKADLEELKELILSLESESDD